MEGMALFLSHSIPRAVTYSDSDGWQLVREHTETYQFNMCEGE